MAATYDAIVVGGGHNGLVAAAYLARSGASENRARRSEYPWIVAMIGYTMLSLWLLAQPLVKEAPATSESSLSAPVAAGATS